MASVLSHPAVPLALAVALGSDRVPPLLVATGCVASVLPDIDSIGFAAGVPYGHTFGHRGFTHSLFFAAAVALLATPIARHLGASPVSTFAFVFASMASHGLLDAMTTGGLGVAFWSPFSNERYFLPWRRIVVSPIGVAPFFSSRGLQVLRSELVWIWAPCAAIAALGLAARKVLRLG
jgi:inner membrane protein